MQSWHVGVTIYTETRGVPIAKTKRRRKEKLKTGETKRTRMTNIAVYVVVLLLSATVGFSSAAVHLVGDSAGWTVGPDYAKWASGETIRVGDTIVFKYQKSIHNVLEVNKEDYGSCKADSPIQVHNTGSDSISIKSPGHHYYICGSPGHCPAGQKVDILVTGDDSSAAVPASSPASTPATSDRMVGSGDSAPPANSLSDSTPVVATPKASGASGIRNRAGFALAVLVIAVVSGFTMH